jgi:hypothetical protein
MTKDYSEKPQETPKGLKWWGGYIRPGRYSYWIRTGPGENDLIHLDMSEHTTPEELDTMVEFMNYLTELKDEKRTVKAKRVKKARPKQG